jgi:hypothetical protein
VVEAREDGIINDDPRPEQEKTVLTHSVLGLAINFFRIDDEGGEGDFSLIRWSRGASYCRHNAATTTTRL